MGLYITKVVVSAVLIVLVSELAKKESLLAAAIASLPVVSILAFFWIYIDTQDTSKITLLAGQIFWLVLPSLVLFLSLPILLKMQLGFYLSMAISMSLTALCYLALIAFLKSQN